jgi:glycosyltransferase involved in cell wall biosynthesis
MSRINVLLANDHLGFGNTLHGVGRLFSLWVPRFNRDRVNVVVCILRGEDEIGRKFKKEFERLGVKIRFLGRGKFNPFTLLDLVNIVREERIDVMHLQAYGASTFGRIAGLLTGVPVIVHAHDNHTNYPWYQRIADMLLGRFTDRAIAVSESVRASCIKKRKIPKDRVIVMHNGISFEQFRVPSNREIEEEKKRLGIELEFKVVGTLSKLRKEKGVEYLIKAIPAVLEDFPGVVFLIVGDGPLRGELEALTRALRVEKSVIFTGYREDVARVLSVFDIKVLPSVTEGFGIAILEAMAMGKPVIATGVGGVNEILKDGETGFLVPPEDPKALSERIIYLLRNEDEARQLGIRAREESKKYDIDLCVRRLEELYFELGSYRRGK